MAIGNLLKTSALSALVASLALAAMPAEARENGRGSGLGQVRVEGSEGRGHAGRGMGNAQPRPQAPVSRAAPPPVQRALPPVKTESGAWRGRPATPPVKAPDARGWNGRNDGIAGNGRERPAWRGQQPGSATPAQPARPPVRVGRQGWNDGDRGGDNQADWRNGRGPRDADGRGGIRPGDRNDDNRAGDNRWSSRNGNNEPAWRGNGSNRNWRDGDRDRNWRDRNRNARDGDRRWRDGDRDRHRWANRDRHRWNNDWRRDNRYDWQGYRSHNRHVYRMGNYHAPYRNYYYSRIGAGFFLDSLFYSSNYWISDPYHYRLPPVEGPYRWVRYYGDVLLVDIYSGEVLDVIHDFFW